MTEQNDPRFATTLARGLSVLRAFRVTDDGLSNAEIAQRTGLPKSTVSRLTFTLLELGYLVQSPRDDRFRPGPTLVAVGHVAAASLSFLVPAHDLGEGGLTSRERQGGEFAVRAGREIKAHRASAVSAFTTARSNVLAWSGRRICRLANIWFNVSFWSSPIAPCERSTAAATCGPLPCSASMAAASRALSALSSSSKARLRTVK